MLKFCLFIDGLDVYEGEHLDIVQLLKDIVLPRMSRCTFRVDLGTSSRDLLKWAIA